SLGQSGFPAARRTGRPRRTIPRRPHLPSSALSADHGRPTAPSAYSGRHLEVAEAARPHLLNIAQRRMAVEIVIERTLPPVVVGLTPQAAVIRRAGIREQRHRVVRPDP